MCGTALCNATGNDLGYTCFCPANKFLTSIRRTPTCKRQNEHDPCSASAHAGYTACVAPAIEITPPTPTSDRACFDSGGCQAYPCSAFSSGCLSVFNNAAVAYGRQCLPCIDGLHTEA